MTGVTGTSSPAPAGELGTPDARGQDDRLAAHDAARGDHASDARSNGLQANRPGPFEKSRPARRRRCRQRLNESRAAHLGLVGQPQPAGQQPTGDAAEQWLPPTQVVSVDPFGGEPARRLPALLTQQVGPLGLGAGHAQDAGRAVLDVQADLVKQTLGQSGVFGAPEQCQLEERVGERRLDLWRQHARRDARRPGRQVPALEQRDARSGESQEVGDGAADHPTADDHDVGAVVRQLTWRGGVVAHPLTMRHCANRSPCACAVNGPPEERRFRLARLTPTSPAAGLEGTA